MAEENQATLTPGTRVRWGRGDSLLGTLVELARDEDTGEVELCGDEECGNRPLWHIRFDDGRIKKYCCEGSIREILPTTV